MTQSYGLEIMMRKSEGFGPPRFLTFIIIGVAALGLGATAPKGCATTSAVITPTLPPPLESANPERQGDGYFERSFSMSLKSELLDTIDRIDIHVPPGQTVSIEGTDAIDAGDLSIPLLIHTPGLDRDLAVQDWLQSFAESRKVSGRVLSLKFPTQFCQRSPWGSIEGVCVGKMTLRTPKQKLIDLSVTGWSSAEIKSVRARTLELAAPARGTLRMNGTLANVVLRGGGPGFHAMIENVLAADPANPDAGDFTAHLDAFRTLVLTRIQGHVRIDAVATPDTQQFLRVDDREIQTLPFLRD